MPPRWTHEGPELSRDSIQDSAHGRFEEIRNA
jgi:hypothetical protein